MIMIVYLLLDKDDITKVCGRITAKELKNEMNTSQSGVYAFVSAGKVFRDKYILVEEETKNESEEMSLLVVETDTGKKYYAMNSGSFYVIYKSGKKKVLEGYMKRRRGDDIWYVKLGNRDYCCKNLVAQLFIREYKSGDTVMLKDDRNPKNVSVENLIVIDKAKYARMTGPMSRSKKVALYEDGKRIRTFRSAREAGRKCFCSYQTVLDACNNRYKTKLFDFRWI